MIPLGLRPIVGGYAKDLLLSCNSRERIAALLLVKVISVIIRKSPHCVTLCKSDQWTTQLAVSLGDYVPILHSPRRPSCRISMEKVPRHIHSLSLFKVAKRFRFHKQAFGQLSLEPFKTSFLFSIVET